MGMCPNPKLAIMNKVIKTMALFGATGTTGRATALAQQRAGHVVTVLDRSNPHIPGIVFQRIDVSASFTLDPQTLSSLASRSGALQDAWAIDHNTNLNIITAPKPATTKSY